MRKTLIILSLTLNALFVLFFLGKHIYYKYGFYHADSKQAFNDSTVIYKFNKYKLLDGRRALFNAMNINKSDILFIGDSETDFFPVSEIFYKYQAKNRGVSASTSKDVSVTVNNLTIPDKVFLMVGINDITAGIPKDTTISNINKIVSLSRSKNTAVKIYIESILPVADSVKTKKAEVYNAAIADYCLKNHIAFINLFPLFLTGKSITPNLTYDDVHLTGEGYLIWKNALIKYL